jgi:hypothetical protein
MNKTPKENSPQPPPSPRTPARQNKPQVTAKSASEAAEREKKLDLILHRFAKLL